MHFEVTENQLDTEINGWFRGFGSGSVFSQGDQCLGFLRDADRIGWLIRERKLLGFSDSGFSFFTG